MKKISAVFSASIAALSLVSDHAKACDYNKAQAKDVKTLLNSGIARMQPYPFIISFRDELRSLLLRTAPDQYSAVLNAKAPKGITFSIDPKRINFPMFKDVGMLTSVAVCHDKSDFMSAIDLAKEIKGIDGVFTASPDTFLYPIKPIPYTMPR